MKTALFTLKELSGLAIMAQAKCDVSLNELVELITQGPNRQLVQITAKRLKHWLRWLDANRKKMTDIELLKSLSRRIKQTGKRQKKGSNMQQADDIALGLINWAYAVKTKHRVRILQRDYESSPH